VIGGAGDDLWIGGAGGGFGGNFPSLTYGGNGGEGGGPGGGFSALGQGGALAKGGDGGGQSGLGGGAVEGSYAGKGGDGGSGGATIVLGGDGGGFGFGGSNDYGGGGVGGGGPTPTMAIPKSSPATGAGTSVSGVTTDQRGYTRPAHTPSLGAYDPLTVAPSPPAPPPSPPSPPSPPLPPATASIQFVQVTVVPNVFALNQTETIEVHISSPGVVAQGMVTFTVDGQTVSASVDGNGDATASLTLPLTTAASPQNIDAVFSGVNLSSAHATQTALWMPWNALLPSIDTFAADGSQAVQSYLFGVPFLDFSYTSSGQLTEVVLGPNLLSWDFLYFGGLSVAQQHGVLPMM
jgi:hypothetical protein